MSGRRLVAVGLAVPAPFALKVAVQAFVAAAQGDTGDTARSGVVALGVVVLATARALAGAPVGVGRSTWRR